MVIASLKGILRALHREGVFYLALIIVLLVILGGFGFYFTEPLRGTRLAHLGEGLWWALVTMTTVGYGDVVPQTVGGRLVGSLIMVGGLVNISLVTATVASIFIGRKFRQERGLEALKTSNHLVILGTHEDGVALLEQILRRLPASVPVVLVNQLPPEQLENMRQKFSTRDLAYVYGDYSREDILSKANVRAAFKAIILGGRREGETAAQADQRTLLTALTLRSMSPQIPVLAELHLRENRPYVERAGVDEVIIRGQFDSSLLAGAIATPGLFRVFTSLMIGDGQNLWTLEIPSRYYGRPVKDLATYLKEHHQALLVAVFTEGRGLSLNDLLSEQPSAIDEFIRRKFSDTGMTHLFGRAKVDFQVNPPDTLKIEPQHKAVVIAAQRPEI